MTVHHRNASRDGQKTFPDILSFLKNAGLIDFGDQETGKDPFSPEHKAIFRGILEAWENLKSIENRLATLRQPTRLDLERAQNEAARAMREAQNSTEKAHNAWPTDEWVNGLPETIKTVLHGIVMDKLLRERRETTDRLMGLLKTLGTLNGGDGPDTLSKTPESENPASQFDA